MSGIVQVWVTKLGTFRIQFSDACVHQLYLTPYLVLLENSMKLSSMWSQLNAEPGVDVAALLRRLTPVPSKNITGVDIPIICHLGHSGT